MRLSCGIAVGCVWQLAASAGPIIIDYTNALAAAKLPQSVMDRIGQQRWFFAHASVGDNIMGGIVSLHAANPGYYQLTRVSEDATPPATTQPGVIYDYMRGNPGWQAKIDSFGNYLTNGWRMPRVDIVLNKLCWIDQTADLNYYITRTAALEIANPRTTFVYSTLPLDTTTGADNAARNIFNNGLRAWVRANNRVLYDLADMEARDTNGVVQTFVYTNRTWELLFSGYTSDGGHLTTAPAQQMAALGLYGVGAALITADRDGDGMPDWWENANGFNPLDPADASGDPDRDGMSNLNEYLAGTDPKNPELVLRTKVDLLSGGLFQIEFSASSNVTYVVQYCSAAAPGSWADLATIAAQPADRTAVFTDSAAAPGRFYRVYARRNP